jgi:hypothetical protein
MDKKSTVSDDLGEIWKETVVLDTKQANIYRELRKPRKAAVWKARFRAENRTHNFQNTKQEC